MIRPNLQPELVAAWSGFVSFGLVHVPVKLYSAVRRPAVRFRMLTRDGQHRLRRKLYAPDTGEEYQAKQAIRGYEIEPDRYIVITEQELAGLKPQAHRAIQIAQVVDPSEIDAAFYKHPYYLAPDGDDTAYELLRRALDEAGKVAIGKFIMHGREHLGAITPTDGALYLLSMNFDDDLLAPEDIPGLPLRPRLAARELDLARQLVTTLARPFQPDSYHEEFREKVLELIDRKATGEECGLCQPAVEPNRTQDLAMALEASLQRAQQAPA